MVLLHISTFTIVQDSLMSWPAMQGIPCYDHFIGHYFEKLGSVLIRHVVTEGNFIERWGEQIRLNITTALFDIGNVPWASYRMSFERLAKLVQLESWASRHMNWEQFVYILLLGMVICWSNLSVCSPGSSSAYICSFVLKRSASKESVIRSSPCTWIFFLLRAFLFLSCYYFQ